MRIIADSIGVDAGLIAVADWDYYTQYKLDGENRQDTPPWHLMHEVEVTPGKYDICWRIKNTWNGAIEGKGIVDCPSGRLIVCDPCYLTDDWERWLQDSNFGQTDIDGIIIIDQMGGDGVYDVALSMKKLPRGA